jgi:hypothetical protein
MEYSPERSPSFEVIRSSSATMMFLPTVFLSLLTLATSSPLAMRTAPPFQGKGQLATLLDGAQVGCLTSNWQMTVNSTQCATFKATLVTQETPKFGTVSWTSINSTEGACGYEVYPNNSGIENTQYILGCGKVASGFNTQLDVSISAREGKLLLTYGADREIDE